MTKGSAVEQLYHEVKAELTSRTHLPGQRIDVADLCERYAVSPTPMRNVLNRLVGESIVETHSHDGFYIPRITESSLRDMLAWSEHLLVLAIDAASDTAPRTGLPEPSDDVVVETETLFREMARLNPNGEIDLAIASLNDRLRSLRRLPDAQAIDSGEEVRDLRAEWGGGSVPALRLLVQKYHAGRQSALTQIIALAYTAPVTLPLIHRGRSRPPRP